MIEINTPATEEHEVREWVRDSGPLAGKSPQDLVDWVDDLDLANASKVRAVLKALLEELYWHRKLLQRLRER